MQLLGKAHYPLTLDPTVGLTEPFEDVDLDALFDGRLTQRGAYVVPSELSRDAYASPDVSVIDLLLDAFKGGHYDGQDFVRVAACSLPALRETLEHASYERAHAHPDASWFVPASSPNDFDGVILQTSPDGFVPDRSIRLYFYGEYMSNPLRPELYVAFLISAE